MATEREPIEAMQKDTAIAKRALVRIADLAGEVATINHAAGRSFLMYRMKRTARLCL